MKNNPFVAFTSLGRNPRRCFIMWLWQCVNMLLGGAHLLHHLPTFELVYYTLHTWATYAGTAHGSSWCISLQKFGSWSFLHPTTRLSFSTFIFWEVLLVDSRLNTVSRYCYKKKKDFDSQLQQHFWPQPLVCQTKQTKFSSSAAKEAIKSNEIQILQ